MDASGHGLGFDSAAKPGSSCIGQRRLVGPSFRSWWQKAFFFTNGAVNAAGDVRTSEELYGLFVDVFGEDIRSICSVRPALDFDNGQRGYYYLPTMQEMLAVFENRSSLHTPQRHGVFECEAFAYSLKMDCILHRCETPAVITPMAVGILWGSDENGQDRHVANLAAVSDGNGGVGLQVFDAMRDDHYDASSWGRMIDYLVI